MLRLYRLQRRRQALLTRYQTVAVASTHMRDEYRRHGVADDRLQLLPLFPTGQCPDPQPPSPRDPMGRILFVGRLTDLKGGLLLVEALRLARPVLPMPLTLTVAGDGPERQQMEFAARQAGIATEFTGWVDAQQREQLMRRADLLAVPATWPEPFGLVGVEAGCVGLPAVGFAVGGIPDWLRAGESGELAPGDPPTAPGLAEAIVRALSEPARWHHIRQGAWRTAQQFTLERHLTGLEELFRRAIGSTRRAEWPLCSVEVGG
jgi:glycosyltransferase involved in cell wall biosynthesis